MGIYLSAQGYLLGQIRPAQLLGRFHQQNRASVVWSLPSGVTGRSLQDVFGELADEGMLDIIRCGGDDDDDEALQRRRQPLNSMSSLSGLSVNDERRGQRTLPTMYFYTGLTWLDVVDVVVDEQMGQVRLTSSSTSWVPAGVPLSPLLGVAFFWVVFFDHGANIARLERLHAEVETRLGAHVEQRVVWAGKVMRPIEYVLVFLLFGITLIATALNYMFNHIVPLNIAVTVVCLTLTVHTFITLTCAVLQRCAARKQYHHIQSF